MKALTTLRHTLILVLFLTAAATASATDGSRKQRKARKAGTERVEAQKPRREVAAFVDPTLPLAVMVENIRAERRP